MVSEDKHKADTARHKDNLPDSYQNDGWTQRLHVIAPFTYGSDNRHCRGTHVGFKDHLPVNTNEQDYLYEERSDCETCNNFVIAAAVLVRMQRGLSSLGGRLIELLRRGNCAVPHAETRNTHDSMHVAVAYSGCVWTTHLRLKAEALSMHDSIYSCTQ